MRAPAPFLAFGCVAALLLAGCGGGDGEDTTSAPTTTTTATATAPDKDAVAKRGEQGTGGSLPAGSDEKGSKPKSTPSTPPPVEEHSDSGGGAAQFRSKGGDNSIQESGSEASPAEREEAALALHGYLDAAARRDLPSACYFMSSELQQTLASFFAKSPEISGGGCPGILEALWGNLPEQSFVKAAEADVGSLRQDGDKGFLLYKGAEDTNYTMPMVIEKGRWKVNAISGSVLF